MKKKIRRVRRAPREFIISGEYRTTTKSASLAFEELARYFAGLAKIMRRPKTGWRAHRELVYNIKNSHSAALPGSGLRVASNIMDVAVDQIGDDTIMRARRLLFDEAPDSTDVLQMHGSIEEWAKKLAARIKEQTHG